ncbi:hypothetical protein BG003_000955 [Podila horticola]|nr:hypothetical protein BG003_000955 [Podila horticola]
MINDFAELSSITEALYRRAALVCPRLVEFHLPSSGPFDHLNDLNGLNNGLLTLRLAQELFPKTRFFSLQCCMPREWKPSYDLRHFLGQLTHVEIDSEPWFDLQALNRMLGYTHSVIHLSAPLIRYHSVQRGVFKRSTAKVMSPTVTCRTRSCTLKHQRQLYCWHNDWNVSPNRRHKKNLERVKKRLRSENCLMERHLTASARWRCSNLQTLDLGLGDVSGHEATFEHISRTCPRLVELTLRMEEFWLSECWGGYHGYAPFLNSYTSKHTRGLGRPILSLGSLAVAADGSEGVAGRKPLKEDRLSYLKRLSIVTVCIPGVLNASNLDFMMMQSPGSENVPTTRTKMCYWPRLEYFSVEYRDIPHLWHKGKKVYELDCLVKKMQTIRPLVYVDFRHLQIAD